VLLQRNRCELRLNSRTRGDRVGYRLMIARYWRKVMLCFSIIVFAFAVYRCSFAVISHYASLPLRLQPSLLFCESAEWAFGVLRPDQSASHVFQVKNVGNHRLEHVHAVPGCAACTEVVCSASSLEVGESVEVRMTSKLKGRIGKTTLRAVVAADGCPPLLLQVSGVVRDTGSASAMR
jgi:hypothetical protein